MNSKKPSRPQTRRVFIRQAAGVALGTATLSFSLRDLCLINAAVAQGTLTDYKALVGIFLGGGNDANNLVVPTLSSEYAGYAAARSALLAIPQSALLPITPQNNDGHSYGLHPCCPELQSLFAGGQLAIVFNTGSLAYPILRADYQAGRNIPPQLYSHPDQVVQWQTSIPDQLPSTGWGGRCADLLASMQPNAPISMSISLVGATTLLVGKATAPYYVAPTGAPSLTVLSGGRLQSFQNILGLAYPNLQAQTYAAATSHALATGPLVNAAIQPTADPFWNTPFPQSITAPTGGSSFASALGPQLKMVARLIEAGNRSTANGGFGLRRQLFFCWVDGFDLHNGQTSVLNGVPNPTQGAHANLLADLSQCLSAFEQAMQQLGLANNVTAFTMSEFSRSFASNGQGTDHGWGGHHLVLGGAVHGARTYGTFPSLTIGGPDDADRGSWIPTTAVDQYAATLAAWFGVDSSNLSTIFPNLSRFATANLGFV